MTKAGKARGLSVFKTINYKITNTYSINQHIPFYTDNLLNPSVAAFIHILGRDSKMHYYLSQNITLQ